MTPLCPVCEEPMKEHGRAFQCEPCRQIIIFFAVSDASPYLAADGLIRAIGHDRRSPACSSAHYCWNMSRDSRAEPLRLDQNKGSSRRRPYHSALIPGTRHTQHSTNATEPGFKPEYRLFVPRNFSRSALGSMIFDPARPCRLGTNSAHFQLFRQIS
jgi:hypothetical protein